LRLTPGIIIGAALGAIFADMLPSDTLRVIFALFILFVSIQLSVSTQPASYRQLPNDLAIGIMGTIIGSISALVGIGGGSLLLFAQLGAKLAHIVPVNILKKFFAFGSSRA